MEPGECLEFSLVKYPKYIANSYGNARIFFMAKDLIARLDKGPVLCAEGYLFAMERRGYLQAELVMPYRAEIFMQRFMIH